MSDGTGELLYEWARKSSTLCVTIKCEYCSRTSLKLQSNCDGCGAALSIPDAVLHSLTAPTLVYSGDVVNENAAHYLGSPHTNISFDLSQLRDNEKLSDYIQTFLSNQMRFISGVSEFKA